MASADFGAALDRVRWPVRIGYVGVLLLATLSGFRLDADGGAVAGRLGRMLDPGVSARDAVDGLRNVILFAGWGLVWMVTTAPGRSRVALRNAVLTGAGLSLLVEGLQLLSRTRTASVLDLATNTAGAAAGAVTLVLMVLAVARRRESQSFVGVPAAVFALCAGGALVGEALVPLFRQDRPAWAMGGPLDRWAEALDRVAWDSVAAWPYADLLLFLPGGVLVTAALVERGLSHGRAAAWTVAGALALFTGAEVAHGVLGLEILPGAVVVHAVAVALGAGVTAVGLGPFTRSFRGADRPRLLTSGYAAWILLWVLRPYRPETDLAALADKLSGDWWIPLRLLAMRVDTFSAVDVVAGFLLFLPLGALLAVWPLRLRGVLSAFLPAVYLALAAEAGQLLVWSRTLDITDVLVQAAGAAIGWTVVRRGGFRPYGKQLG